MDWGTVISVIGSILAAFCGASAATYFGFKRWREQRWIERRENITEEALAHFYEARDIIKAAREPGSFGHEGQTRSPIEGETEREENYRNSLYIPAERLLSHNEFFAKMEASKYRFMALFGEKQAEPFDEIKKARNRVLISSGMLIRNCSDSREEKEQHRKSREKWERDIGWGLDESDPLAQEVEAAITKIEQICRPLLTARKN